MNPKCFRFAQDYIRYPNTNNGGDCISDDRIERDARRVLTCRRGGSV